METLLAQPPPPTRRGARPPLGPAGPSLTQARNAGMMPRMPSDARTVKEVTDALVQQDGVDRARARATVECVLEEEDLEGEGTLAVYRAARRRLGEDPPGPDEDDARPTLPAPGKPKPARKGTRKDTPAAKKEPKR